MKKVIKVLSLLLVTVFLTGTILSCKSSNVAADGTELSSKEAEKVLKAQKEEDAKAAKEAKEEAKRAAEAAKEAARNQSAEEKAALKAAEKARKEEEKIQAAEAKKRAEEEKRNFARFGDTAELDEFEEIFGIVKFYVNPKRGTFNIAIIDEDGKTRPVLSNLNEYNSTSFYLRKDSRIIKLNQDLGIRRAARKTKNGIQIAYQLDNLAFVLLDFECFNSVQDGVVDSIKVTSTVKSLYKSKADFDLKVVMDTVLGETNKVHFYKYDGSSIKNEIEIHEMKELPWFVSKNSTGALQFLFTGFDTTPIKEVSIASFSTLETKFWEPDLKSYRSFDTIQSYNNSGVAAIWQKHRINTNESFSEVFYLSLSTSDKNPTGDVYIDANSKEKLVREEAEKAEQEVIAAIKPVTPEKPEETEAKPQEPVTTEPGKMQSRETSIGKGIKNHTKTSRLKSGVTTVPGKKPVVVVDNGSETVTIEVTPEKLSQEYIQKLLDRISEIEKSGQQVNREELIKLNAELDAILEYLRK